MVEKPRRVVTSRTRKSAKNQGKFNVQHEMLNLEGPLKEFRESAWKEFVRLPLPTTREESWRRTDIRNLPSDSFYLPSGKKQSRYYDVPRDLLTPIAGKEHAGQISLQTDHAQVSLDPELAKKGVIFTDLQTAEKEHPELVRKLAGEIINSHEGKFAALAAAFAWTGIVLYVPKGVVIDQPLHSILWGDGEAQAIISHLLIWVDEGASVTYVHEAASAPNTSNFHAGLVEIKVSQGANLRFVEL